VSAVQWVDLPPARGRAAERWALTLAEVRAEQNAEGSPAQRWAVVYEGALNTCYSYQRDLRAGLTPGRAAQLDTRGFEFRTQPMGRTGGRLCARWAGEVT
jgi:hypothetical protein